MKSPSPPLLAIALILAGHSEAKTDKALPQAATTAVDFSQEIKPLFEASCVKCHAKGKAKGGFSMETREAFLEGGDSGPVAFPGKSAESYLVELVAGTDPDELMPKKGTRWTPRQIGLLRAWIDQGLKWDHGITFAKAVPENLHPKEVSLPGDRLHEHPIDRLLEPYFVAQHFAPPDSITDPLFARRVYLDVIGLLPSPAQLENFLKDDAPDKRERLVRTLLADRRGFADHWLTFWNDLLRNDYQGTGFIDGGRRQISQWLYSALNNELPFDQFVAQLVNPTVISEGFTKGIIWRGTVNASMAPAMQAAQNISQVFMGVNLKCASCHDSFINDWALADAYGLAAIYSEDPMELVHCDKPTGKKAVAAFLYPQLGNFDGAAAKPARLQRLAEIMTSRQNGRLARTIINRLWASLLGRGLVEPLDEMDKASWNSELLNWLAEDLVAHGYNLKRTIELIATSRAYQLPSVEPEALSHDFRGPLTRRLTAEQFCDALSTLSQNWEQYPSSLEIDFGEEKGLSLKSPQWIWTAEPVEFGRQREAARTAQKRIDTALAKLTEARQALTEAATNGGSLDDARSALALASAEVAAAQAPLKVAPQPAGPAPQLLPASDRHPVVFRKKFTLPQVPDRAYATLLASQDYKLQVNGKELKAVLRDAARSDRIALYDLRTQLVPGENVIAISVSSHTDKQMNDEERAKFPGSLIHLNASSGLAFFARVNAGREFVEITSDDSWRVQRNPDADWPSPALADEGWAKATPLLPGVTPVDEGPGLEPLTRRDYANIPVELGPQLAAAVSIVRQEGKIRASLRVADPLQSALERPNREQVITARATAATTLQALELTNGATLDERVNFTANQLLAAAANHPEVWIDSIYRQLLARAPLEVELALGRQMLGEPVTAEGVADLLWALLNLPEFQFIY